MTGQIAFARTIRALDADEFRASKLGLLLAAILLAAWTWWFLIPGVPQFSTLSENIDLKWEPGSHQVSLLHLTADEYDRIRLVQRVRLRFDGRTVDARVAGSSFFMTPYETRLVSLEVSAGINPPLPSRSAIEIDTGRVSPASIVLRALR